MTLCELKEKYDIADYKEDEIFIPDFTEKKGIVLIVGSSGSGKTTILKSIDSRSVKIDYSLNPIDHFNTIDEAEELLLAFGLRSIPTWFRPMNTLSNGELHRALLAIQISQGINTIDEFTSVVDRNTAKSLSVALKKYADRHSKTIYICSVNSDIEEWLCPDHIYMTDEKKFKQKEFLRRPRINLCIKSTDRKDWDIFSKYHYLDRKMSSSTHCYVAIIDGMKVGFLSVIHGCGRDIKSYWRESRLVVIPEFQGLGIGKCLSDTVGNLYISNGYRYFSKTSHPSVGEYRNKSALWRNTSTNMMKRKSYIKKDGTPRVSDRYGKTIESIIRDSSRTTYSHEYIGGLK